MKRVVQLAVVIGCGLPAAVFETVTILDAIRRGSTFQSGEAREVLIFVGFFAGPGALVLIPAMWIMFRFVASSLSRLSKYALAAFATLSTLGALDFWLRFVT